MIVCSWNNVETWAIVKELELEAKIGYGGPWFRSLLDYSTQKETVQPNTQPHTSGKVDELHSHTAKHQGTGTLLTPSSRE